METPPAAGELPPVRSTTSRSTSIVQGTPSEAAAVVAPFSPTRGSGVGSAAPTRRSRPRRTPAVRAAPLLEGPHGRDLDRSTIEHTVEMMRSRPASAIVRAVRGDHRPGPPGAGGRRRIRSARGPLERQRPRHLGGPGRRRGADRLGATDGRWPRGASLSGAGYANYASPDESSERVRAGYGPERFARLAAVKRRYDPDNVFRFNNNIPPAG